MRGSIVSGVTPGGVILDRAVPIIAEEPTAASELQSALTAARKAQSKWAHRPLRERLAIIRRLRHSIASQAETLAATVPLSVPGSLHRTLAETLAAEVLPLADACRFLEREAASILAPRRLSRRGRPFFLRHLDAVVERDPFGVVLILGPANYPLLLPGVQALQALVAGNAALWKPAPTGADAARMLLKLLGDAGLPDDVVTVLDTDVSAAKDAIDAGVDKVVLTGHIATGQSVLRSLANTATPAVMELSGCDAVFILPGADLHHAARAIAFGLRLNGSATCMAPRRLFVAASEAAVFETILLEHLRDLPAVPLPPSIANELEVLITEATHSGANVTRVGRDAEGTMPVLISRVDSEMRCMQTDLFAPVVSLMECSSTAEAIAAHRACPYALTASIFGPEREARRLASELRVGTVLINDIIVPTADPRLPFGGRGKSGFGVTRGAEGLLEMTAVRTVATQKRADARAYDTTTEAHVPFFSAYIRSIHGSTWGVRAKAMRALRDAARSIPKRSKRS